MKSQYIPTLTLSQMGHESSVSYLLKTHKPRIVVDKDGGELLLSFIVWWTIPHLFLVGSIICRKDTPSPLTTTMYSQSNESRGENGMLFLVTCRPLLKERERRLLLLTINYFDLQSTKHNDHLNILAPAPKARSVGTLWKSLTRCVGPTSTDGVWTLIR